MTSQSPPESEILKKKKKTISRTTDGFHSFDACFVAFVTPRRLAVRASERLSSSFFFSLCVGCRDLRHVLWFAGKFNISLCKAMYKAAVCVPK